jgi:tetratricopeptide (TPR) repeat protein
MARELPAGIVADLDAGSRAVAAGDSTLADGCFARALDAAAGAQLDHRQLADLWRRIGDVFAAAGLFDEAAEWLERAAAQLGDDVEPARDLHRKLAALRLAQGRLADAELHVASYELDLPDAHPLRATASLDHAALALARNDDDAAATRLEQTLALLDEAEIGDERRLPALVSLGALYARHGRPAEARARLEQAVALAQRTRAGGAVAAEAHLRLGELYLVTQEWAEAALYLRGAVERLESAGASVTALALARHNLAGAELGCGNASLAEALLVEARDALQSAGAPEAARVERSLAQLRAASVTK